VPEKGPTGTGIAGCAAVEGAGPKPDRDHCPGARAAAFDAGHACPGPRAAALGPGGVQSRTGSTCSRVGSSKCRSGFNKIGTRPEAPGQGQAAQDFRSTTSSTRQDGNLKVYLIQYRYVYNIVLELSTGR
jgi:hypothetical protein